MRTLPVVAVSAGVVLVVLPSLAPAQVDWTQQFPPTFPGVRRAHGVAYDLIRARTLLFGGMDTARLADTWEWDGTSWTQLSPTTSPSARNNFAMTYDLVRDRVLLFGGKDSTGRMLTITGEEYRVSGVLDEWTPVPKFYDLNNNPYEAPEALYLPFSLAAMNGYSRSGNTSCWKPVADGGFEEFLASECIWIQMWIEMRDKSEKDDYLQFLDAYAAEQKALGRFQRPLNNRLNTPSEWLADREVVDDNVSVLLSIAVLFLVVCLLNTIGLLLAKIMRRAKDISLRRALGASKTTLFAQYIIEAGMIGAAGGMLGVGATWLGLRGIENLWSDYDFIQYLVRMDWTMVLLAVVLAVMSAFAAALYPTWRACNITPASQLRIQ